MAWNGCYMWMSKGPTPEQVARRAPSRGEWHQKKVCSRQACFVHPEDL